MKVIRNCLYCNKEFKAKDCPSRKDRGKYCSISCSRKSMTGTRATHWKGGNRKCIDCGKGLISRSKKVKRCRKCCGISLRGENHPNWKGGPTNIKEFRCSQKSINWAKKIIKRDKYCLWPNCESKENLQAHHIKRIKNNPELSLELSNGICLCKQHHLAIASKEQDYESLFQSIVVSHELCEV